jgi:two-component system, OmpR family, heavy metal sensor histidine kinase CusS
VKQYSFRFRIAFLSALLAGIALIGFGTASLWLIYQTELERIDDSIKNQLLREADRPTPRQDWGEYFASLATRLKVDPRQDLAVLVQSAPTKTVFRSPTWVPHLSQATIFPRSPVMSELPVDRSQLPPERSRPLSQLAPMVTGSTQTGTWRIGAATALPVRIAIAVNLRTLDREMAAIRNAFAVTIPLVLVAIGIGAWWLSGRALLPIRELTADLRRVTVKGLDRRVSTDRIDWEFLELLQVFNQMMARLERSFAQSTRFSADAAHELKTPLSILQGELERAIQSAPSGSELQQQLSGLLDEVRHLNAIVRKLLLLSLADAGQMRLHAIEIDLSEMLTDLVDDLEVLAPDLDVQVQIDRDLQVLADRPLLLQVLQNLMSNAIKYNLPHGWVRIVARQQEQTVFVTISNSSQDLPTADRERIFDRFYRGDPARNRDVEGLGLGLSLAREIAYAHDGDLSLEPISIGQTGFTLALPTRATTFG